MAGQFHWWHEWFSMLNTASICTVYETSFSILHCLHIFCMYFCVLFIPYFYTDYFLCIGRYSLFVFKHKTSVQLICNTLICSIHRELILKVLWILAESMQTANTYVSVITHNVTICEYVCIFRYHGIWQLHV